MLSWLAQNLSTVIVCLVLALILTLIIVKLVKDKKKVNPPAAEIAPIVRWQAPAARNKRRLRAAAERG